MEIAQLKRIVTYVAPALFIVVSACVPQQRIQPEQNVIQPDAIDENSYRSDNEELQTLDSESAPGDPEAYQLTPNDMPPVLDVNDNENNALLYRAATLPPSGMLMMDRIPLFCGVPTVSSIKNGNWTDPTIWSTGTVPTSNAEVAISNGTTVTVNTILSTRLKCINVNTGGTLQFHSNATTKLTVKDFLVMPGGTLLIGTVDNPVPANQTAEIEILDMPIETSTDPASHGTGLIVLGTMKAHGALRTPTFVRFAQEPKAGDTQIVLTEAVNGWQAGDDVKIPDTRQLSDKEYDTIFGRSIYDPIQTVDRSQLQVEERKIASVSPDGKTITLTAPLQYNHLGARDAKGNLVFQGHLMNTTRNIFIHSENPNGTRGHMFATMQADVDIRFMGFYNMGRTTKEPLDSTTFDSSGSPTHIGTNQIARYPLHFHHYRGPAQGQSNGFQGTLIGNSVANSLKFGIVVHGTHFTQVSQNVVFDNDGSGLFVEDGSETRNEIENNMVMLVIGTGLRIAARGSDDFGHNGTCFWFRSPYNYVRNNVCANARRAGYEGQLGGNEIEPLFPGADMMDPKQYRNVQRGGDFTTGDISNAELANTGYFQPGQSFLDFRGNEAYGSFTGFEWWRTIPGVPSRNFDSKAWHISAEGIHMQYAPFTVLINPTFINDKSKISSDTFGTEMTIGYDHDASIIGGTIQNFRFGVTPSQRNFYMTNVQLDNFIDVYHSDCSTGTGCHKRDQNYLYRNVLFTNTLNTTVPWAINTHFDGSTYVSAQTHNYRYALVGNLVNGTKLPDYEYYFKNPVCSATNPAFDGNVCPLGSLPLNTQCSDGIDNDNDGFVDMADLGCDYPEDTTESGGDDMPPTQPVCGNNLCEAGENQTSCPSDCGVTGPVCGNNVCESGETQTNCPADCKSTGPVCGNNVCESGETQSSCPADCEPPLILCVDTDGDGYRTPNPDIDFDGIPDCGAVDCNDNNPAIHPGAQDICSNGIDEDCNGQDLICTSVCGNNVCEPGESQTSCPSDCGSTTCVDPDNDGYGPGCTQGEDCDNGNSAIHPGAQDACGNGIDEDCSGTDAPCGSGTVIQVMPVTQNVSPVAGNTVMVSIDVNSVTDLFGLEMNLSYDSSILSLVDVREGSFLSGGSSNTTFFSVTDMSTPGMVKDIIITKLGTGSGRNGSGTLLTLTFTATTEGTATITALDPVFLNSQQQTISVQTSNGTVISKLSCTEDLNGDGVVNIVDLVRIAISFGKSAGDQGFSPAADVNRDGTIDISDLVLVALKFGQNCM